MSDRDAACPRGCIRTESGWWLCLAKYTDEDGACEHPTVALTESPDLPSTSATPPLAAPESASESGSGVCG